MKFISVVTPCFNEEENVRELYRRVKAVFETLGRYRYEHIFIDNASRDRTVEILKEIAATDRNVKIIVNTRNFGHVRSPFHALLAARGQAVIGLAADLQDPPELIPDFLERWEEGFKVALGVKAAARNRGRCRGFAVATIGCWPGCRMSSWSGTRRGSGFSTGRSSRSSAR